MQEATPPTSQHEALGKDADLEQDIDERDETIRLLNEALSEALAELERLADDEAA